MMAFNRRPSPSFRPWSSPSFMRSWKISSRLRLSTLVSTSTSGSGSAVTRSSLTCMVPNTQLGATPWRSTFHSNPLP